MAFFEINEHEFILAYVVSSSAWLTQAKYPAVWKDWKPAEKLESLLLSENTYN